MPENPFFKQSSAVVQHASGFGRLQAAISNIIIISERIERLPCGRLYRPATPRLRTILRRDHQARWLGVLAL
jgi:hypothetical protein